MSSTKKQARVAGVLYLLVALIATIGILYLPRNLIVRGDATATAVRIVASESLFRIRIASELISTTLMLFLVLALYRLLKEVNEKQALLMVALVVVAVPIGFLLVLNDIAALIVFSRPDFLAVFEKRQLDALGYLFLRLHSHGGNLATIFWGLWLFPFGVLVIQSGFIPRVFGVLLIINCFAYLAQAATGLLLPQYAALVSKFAVAPALAGELAIIAWLLTWGVKAGAAEVPASSLAGGWRVIVASLMQGVLRYQGTIDQFRRFLRTDMAIPS